MAQLARDIEVEVTLLPTEHGGADAPLVTGARPQFYYAGTDWVAQFTIIDAESVPPGHTARAYVTLVDPEEHLKRLRAGMVFLLRHGQRIVGYGRVMRLVDLEASAQQRGRLTSA